MNLYRATIVLQVTLAITCGVIAVSGFDMLMEYAEREAMGRVLAKLPEKTALDTLTNIDI